MDEKWIFCDEKNVFSGKLFQAIHKFLVDKT
jgi:hypothetical protein